MNASSWSGSCKLFDELCVSVYIIPSVITSGKSCDSNKDKQDGNKK
ncbi:hypothetical protein SAMN06297421_101277 [Aristaeella hokkaidonensis]|nr:hypothetical protein SAMN06297421_101277 [Aristaeella hokkaidonensis]